MVVPHLSGLRILVLMFFFFFPSRFSLTIQGFSALLYLAIRSILTSTSLLFLLLSYLASFLFFLRCVKSFKIPVSCKEKPHDFCVFLFPLPFVLYFFYLALLSTLLLPRYLFYIDPYLAIFFILLLPCLSLPRFSHYSTYFIITIQ